MRKLHALAATSHYARSSHVTGSTIQRVALANPYWSKYQVELLSLQPGASQGNLAGLKPWPAAGRSS